MNNKKKIKQNEVEHVLDRLHLGIHSGDGSGINRLHWLGFVDFIIKNPEHPKKLLVHKLISVLCIKERTVLEYINCSLAWDVLRYDNGVLYYNPTFNDKKPKTKPVTTTTEQTDEEKIKNKSIKDKLEDDNKILEEWRKNHDK